MFQHNSTFQALEQQRTEGYSNLSLTPLQTQELKRAQASRNLEPLPILTAPGSKVYYTPDRQW